MLKITLILCATAMVLVSSIPSNGISNLSVQVVTSQSVNPERSQDFNGKSNVLVQVVTTQEMDDSLNQYPHAQLINPEISQYSKLIRQPKVLIYSQGQRQSGDRLVCQGTDSTTFAAPHNVELKLSYPPSGTTGANLTYWTVEVDQSSDVGSGNVVSGGIGQNNIALDIQAQNTLYFNYICSFYGI